MRPPPQRNFVGKVETIRPQFGTKSGPTPAPDSTNFSPENKDSLLTQACIRGHQTNAIPLLDTNRYRSHAIGDYSRTAPNPKLAPRSIVPPKPPIVKTWE
jgi:hypothetical protein